MRFEIPAPLTVEHHRLHVQLVKATKEPGAVGEAASEVAHLMHPHFIREEQFALPPLALLEELAHDGVRAEMAEVLPMTHRLKAEFATMLDEHQHIVDALDRLRSAAHAARLPEYESFANELILHAQMEELVLYPAAVLVGEFVAERLKEPAEIR